MKKLKKQIKKFPKRFLSILLVLTTLFSSVIPITKTKAQENVYGEGDVKLQLHLGTANGYELLSATVNGSAWEGDYQDPENESNSQYYRYKSTDGNYTIVISVKSTNEKDPTVVWGGPLSKHLSITSVTLTQEEDDYKLYEITVAAKNLNNYSEANVDNQGIKNVFIHLNVDESQSPQNPGNGTGQSTEPHTGGDFGGSAILVWSCKNGGICYHRVDGIPNFDDGVSYFIKASDMVDARTGEKFDVNAKYKGWSIPEQFDKWVADYKNFHNINGDINWAKVNPEDMLSAPIDKRQYEDAAIKNGCSKKVPEDEFMDCVDNYLLDNKIAFPSRAHLQPLGEPQYPNAYVSYGDRNFKVVVYNDDYRGISYGNLSDLHYYPAQWGNAYLSRDEFDISNTTKDNPESIPAILLEDTLNIKALSNYNGFEITKLEALDVPKEAVKITKANGEWKLEFSSNFYDKVLFKATGNDGGTYYFRVDRYTIDGWIRGEGSTPILTADFYYDRNESYSNFNLTAKILYKDGTEKNVTLKPVKRIDDGLGNITKEYEVDEENPEFGPGGKGLKRSVFEYTLAEGEDRKIQDVYINAEYKGSTATNYAGAFSGSGKGVLANIYHGEEN